MANTFKFGNGNWATKEDSVLAYNDENNNFKPLPFDFTRASTATYVDSDGLIKTAGNGEARIDYTDSTDGALLLEPARTNSLLQSNQFDTTWVIGASALDLTSGQSGVGGSNDAWLLKKNTTGSRYIQQQLSLSSATYSYSVYMKAESTNWAYFWSYDGSASVNAYIDLENGVVGDTSGSNLDDVLIESVGNGWYRVTLVYTQGTTLVRIYPAYSNGSVSTGTDDGIYIQNAQLEAASYATSYIPTSGSAVTRVAEHIALTLPNADSFSSSNGFSVISKYGIGAAGAGTSSPFLFFNVASNTYIGFGSTNERLRCRINLSGTAYLNTQSNALRTQDNSLFISCDSSGWSQGANGTTNFTGSNDTSVIDKLASISVNAYEIYGIIKIKELLIYNTRLTNAELEALTT